MKPYQHLIREIAQQLGHPDYIAIDRIEITPDEVTVTSRHVDRFAEREPDPILARLDQIDRTIKAATRQNLKGTGSTLREAIDDAVRGGQ